MAEMINGAISDVVGDFLESRPCEWKGCAKYGAECSWRSFRSPTSAREMKLWLCSEHAAEYAAELNDPARIRSARIKTAVLNVVFGAIDRGLAVAAPLVFGLLLYGGYLLLAWLEGR